LPEGSIQLKEGDTTTRHIQRANLTSSRTVLTDRKPGLIVWKLGLTDQIIRPTTCLIRVFLTEWRRREKLKTRMLDRAL
jgi:hypothetical protein